MGFASHERELSDAERRAAGGGALAMAPPPAPLLSLQSTLGNHAVARLVQQWREEAPSPARYLLRKDVTIVGPPTKTFRNLGKMRGTATWKALVEPLVTEYGQETVEFHLNQLFSAKEDIKFESDEHFVQALTYDCENKTTGGEHNLQEQYLTLYGWKRRRERALKAEQEKSATPKGGGKRGGKGQPQPAKWVPEEEEAEAPVLKIYRTMKLVNWERLKKDDHTALTGHMGDFKQAHNYLHRRSPEPKVLVEFTLKPGAERTLFSGSTMAFPDDPGALKVPNIMKETLKAEGVGDSYAVASTNEGLAKGKVGIKAEGGEAGFSFGIGGGDSAKLFLSLVAEKNVLYSSVVDPTAEKEEDEQGLAPEEGEESAKQEGTGESSKAETSSEKASANGDGRKERLEAFRRALLEVPQEVEPEEGLVEAADPSNQYAQVDEGQGKTSSASKPKRYEASRLKVRRNPGGGDCLFHAIAGRTLSEEELLQLRQIVASMRAGLPENQPLNAQHVAAALHQTEHEYAGLMTGRHNIPNTVYALLQAVPGMYAGEDELIQWCMRGQNRRVVVIDSTAPLGNGALAVFTSAGRVVVPVTEDDMYAVAQSTAGEKGLVLFKTPGHWERVDAIDRT